MPSSWNAEIMDESRLEEKLQYIRITVDSPDISIKNLQSTVNDLLDTADAPQISVKHRVAACNVLCGAVEQCLSSNNDDIRLTVCHGLVPERLTTLYVGRYDHVKAKAMKQVLNTLIRLLRFADTLDLNPRPSLVALEHVLRILALEGDNVKAKPALHALTFMINKNLFLPSDIILAFERWCLNDHGLGELATQSSDLDAFQLLIKVILRWIKYSDVAATAGQFLTTLLNEKNLPITKTSFINTDQNLVSTPKWTAPLLVSIRDDPGALPAFRTYAFPGLFQLDVCGYWAFLQQLGIARYLNPLKKNHESLRSIFTSEEVAEEVLFSVLQTGKECSLLKIEAISYDNSLSLRDNYVSVPDRLVERLLANSSSVARLAGLTLLISSHQMTMPLTKWSLEILKNHVPHLFADTNSNFRGEVQGLMQSLVDRLRAVTFNIDSNINRSQIPNKKAPTFSQKSAHGISMLQLHECLQIHIDFLKWFIGFLNAELHTCASYQRHISALKSLKILLRSGLDFSVPADILAKQTRGDIRWVFHLSILGSHSKRQLMDLLLDAFDDVRQASLSLLHIYCASSPQTTSRSLGSESKEVLHLKRTELDQAISRGQILMMQTGRVDHADGLARLYDLSCFASGSATLTSSNDVILSESIGTTESTFDVVEGLVCATEDAITMARDHLYTAVGKAPVHGLFTSLRYSVSYLAKPQTSHDSRKRRADLVDRMLKCVSEIWTCVQHLLCNDAPEGHMPEDAEGETDMTTKDIFSYSWRALKDSSLLLREIVANGLDDLLNISGQPGTSYESWGDLCFQQLAELRHRGAFSTVSQTFYVVCDRCVKHQHGAVNDLVKGWYHATQTLILQRGSTTTRRSAGIPALMVSILSADPKSKLFDAAIHELQELALSNTDGTNPEDLPQVHALNSLKAIFTSTKLASRSERYITSSIRVAAKCLGSTVWAIRNCGLMLFRGLFDRLLGSDQKLVSSTKQGPQVTSLRWEAYPGLLELLISMLENSHATTILPTETQTQTFSELQAETIFPAIDIFRRVRPPQEQFEHILSLVRKALSSPQWHVRVIASRTCAVLSESGKQQEDEVMQLARENTVHGHLLTWRHKVRDVLIQNDASKLFRIQKALSAIPSVLSTKYHSGNTWAALSDTLIDLGEFHIKQFSSRSVATSADDHDLSQSLQRQGQLDYLKMASSFEEAITPYLGFRATSLLERSARLVFILGDMIADASVTAESTDMAARSNRIASTMGGIDADISLWLAERLEMIIEATTGYRSLALINALLHILASTDQEYLANSTTAAFCGLLATAFVHDASKAAWTLLPNLAQRLATLELSRMFWNSSTPLEAENILRLWGFSADAKYCVKRSWSPQLTSEVLQLINVCKAALDESSEFPLRFAAISSLNALDIMVEPTSHIPNDLEVPLLLAIYKGCIDDDEEIREIAGKTAVKALENKRRNPSRLPLLSPPIASQMICQHLVKHFGNSTILRQAALHNFFGFSFATLGPFESCLREALYRDTSLFATEKQNLYIDPAKEAHNWACILRQLDTRTIPADIIHSFTDWTVSGLQLLIAKSGEDLDGPLGWTSKPEVFTLGLQVIYAAEVLLLWRTATKKVKVRGSGIRQLLAKLEATGTHCQLHEVWRREIERILEKSVLARLGHVHRVLQSARALTASP